MDTKTPILEFRDIEKRFAMVHALKSVSLEIAAGETMALVGENGAGKSTLMKILTGVYVKDSGDILIDGKSASIPNTQVAKRYGIGQVYQQAELVPELTVAENIFLGEPGFGDKGRIKWERLFAAAEGILEKYGLPVRARARVRTLNVAHRQLVAIAKVLQRAPRILILDEPTAVLSDKEVALLFGLISQLKREKVTIIYISHRLEEVFRIADRIAVMRDGSLVTVLDNKDLTKEKLIVHMLGRRMNAMFPPKGAPSADRVVLSVRQLSTAAVSDISFELRKGEILGLAGLVGSGRTELARALYGLDRITGGTVSIDGERISIGGPADVVKRGVFLAPEDRRGEGLVLMRSIRENVTLSRLGSVSSFGWCFGAAERNAANELKLKLNIKAATVETPVGHLSGGNQQKVVIAKALMAQPRVLIFDEPTQGIDVGAKAEIYGLLQMLKDEGMAILFISSEIEELQGVCTRLLVMRNGRLAGEVGADLSDSEKILSLMYRS